MGWKGQTSLFSIELFENRFFGPRRLELCSAKGWGVGEMGFRAGIYKMIWNMACEAARTEKFSKKISPHGIRRKRINISYKMMTPIVVWMMADDDE